MMIILIPTSNSGSFIDSYKNNEKDLMKEISHNCPIIPDRKVILTLLGQIIIIQSFIIIIPLSVTEQNLINMS